MQKLGGGFRVPDEEHRIAATGDQQHSPVEVKKSIQAITNCFLPIPAPGPSDWLANHKESGETFDEFARKSRAQISEECKIIFIQPLDLDIPEHFTNCLRDYCGAFFLGADIEVGKPVDLDNMGVKHRINSYSNKIQFDANGIIARLRKNLTKQVFCVIGLTMRDLYP